MPPMVDLTGQRFGHLQALWPAGRDRRGEVYWVCQCDCSKPIPTRSGDLRSGNTTSCGCQSSRNTMGERSTRHGYARKVKISSEYRTYQNAKNRCNSPKNKRYADYGGRGVEFRFDSFEGFHTALGDKPTPQHSIDRIDVNGHYEPSNVRWATAKEQRANQRRSKVQQ